MSSVSLCVRHGERADHVQDCPFDNKSDPQLTPTGIEQAKKTGLFLKEYFASNNLSFSSITIECSPFVRCKMTAAQIALHLGVQKVRINYLASELLCTHLFDEDPVSKIYHLNGGDSKGYLPEGIEFENSDFYKQEILAAFPENDQ